MHKYKFFSTFLIAFLFLTLVSCQPSIPKDALRLSPESLRDRQIQSRVFETDDEKKLLIASAALLQDLGYNLDETEPECGVIVCSRDRDVTETGQVVGAVFAALLGAHVAIDKHQKVMASLVTRPISNKQIAVRITFQHMVWNTDNILVKNEQINDPKIYEDFFSKLSKSVFLTAHDI